MSRRECQVALIQINTIETSHKTNITETIPEHSLVKNRKLHGKADARSRRTKKVKECRDGERTLCNAISRRATFVQTISLSLSLVPFALLFKKGLGTDDTKQRVQ
jgi:hypothetical protein